MIRPVLSSDFQVTEPDFTPASPSQAPLQRASSPVPSLQPRMSVMNASSTLLRSPEAPVAGVCPPAPKGSGVTSGAPQSLCPVSLLPLLPWDDLRWVEELSGGQSDGAYRLNFVNHPSVVLKSCRTAGAQAFAMALAPTVGIRAPLVRWAPNGSTEVEALQVALQRLSDSPDENVEAKRLLRRIAVGGKSVLVMEHLSGVTLGATGRAYLKNNDAEALLGAIGRLAAFDLILGNQDRFENFDPNDCLGGGGWPANFGNVFLPWGGKFEECVAAIDTCVSDDPLPGVERNIHSKGALGYFRNRTTPSALLADILAHPDTLNDYVSSNIVQMLAQVWLLPPNAGETIQRAFIAGLHTVAEKITPAQLESIRSALGIDDKALPIATLESRIQALRELLNR